MSWRGAGLKRLTCWTHKKSRSVGSRMRVKKSARPVADGCYGADHRRARLNRLIPKGKVKHWETSARQETSPDLTCGSAGRKAG